MFRGYEKSNNSSGFNGTACCIGCITFAVYILLSIVTTPQLYKDSPQTIDSQFIANLSQPDSILTITDALPPFYYGQIYQGHWQQINSNQLHPPFLNQTQGNLRMHVNWKSENFPYFSYYSQHLQLQFLRQEYVDQGSLCFSMYLDKYYFGTDKQSDKKVTFYLSTNNPDGNEIDYQQKNIFQIQNKGTLDRQTFNFTAEAHKDQLSRSILFSIDNHQFNVNITSLQNKVWAYHLLGILFAVLSLSAIELGTSITETVQNSKKTLRQYSFLTIALTIMQDSTLSLLCFSMAIGDFGRKFSPLLFLIPCAFYFMNAMSFSQFFLYYAGNGKGKIFKTSIMGIFMGKVICLFFFFASSVVVKFLLGLTDLNWFFFIGISLVILPQIYTNASNNVRPQVFSRYHFYLFSRFLLIGYLRCYPGNIYLLEPDYLLCFFCLLLVGGQFYLLVLQNKRGPRSVVPSFLATFDEERPGKEPLELEQRMTPSR